MKIGFASDHAGIELKLALMEHLTAQGHTCTDYGNYDPNDRNDDYPVYGRKAAEAKMIADTFFTTEFEGGRHARRVDMITEIESDYRGISKD